MFLVDLFRSFLPFQNPIGFGASDFLELGLAVMLVLLTIVSRPGVEPYAAKLAGRTGWCMLLLAILPVALRLLLLPNHPVPTPDIFDEYGHLFVADTLRHFRLANPAHPLHQFFETFFVLQEPTYSSIYPIGQGLMLALGRAIFGLPWAGVILSVAAFCSLCYWMLKAWTTPMWALVGALLAVIEFGPLSQWMNNYWGGAFAATAGCLVFGALPRLRETWRTRDAVWLGLGLAMHLLTRPYESIFLVLSVMLFFAPALRRRELMPMLARGAAVVILVVAPAVALTLFQNKQVTGSWTTLPYMLSQYQYGVPAALTFESNPIPHRELTPQQALEYKVQSSFRAKGPETLEGYLTRLGYRVRFYRFFFLAPLYVILPFFFSAFREYRFVWVALTLLLFALGINFFPAFQLHYLAAVTGLFVLVSVTGLQQISRLRVGGWPAGLEAARLVIFLCVAHFVFWYGLHVFDNTEISMALRRYETWNGINHQNPERRIAINRQLAAIQGRLLVFVRYYPQHIFQEEWVYDAAGIDAARVVLARDLGPAENEKLQHYYGDRAAWLLEPDFQPPKLARYEPSPPSIPAEIPTTKPSPKTKRDAAPLKLIQVR